MKKAKFRPPLDPFCPHFFFWGGVLVPLAPKNLGRNAPLSEVTF